MLRVNNISKKYSGIYALDKVSFEVQENSITGIIGPNGAGKSTLLRIITGFELADEGEIYFNGKILSSLSEKNSLFSYMPEYCELYPDYYVNDFLSFIHKITGYFDSYIFDALELENVKNKKIRHLSKGYRQRLKLYFALSNRKKVIILDEPFEGFDPIQLVRIMEVIRREKEAGKTFLITIHQLNYAEKICDDYILLNEGKVVAWGNIEALRQKYSCTSLEQIFMRALQ